MSSNSVVRVPREWAHSSISGVDFGGNCWVLIRSPDAVLLWIYGHSSSVNGHRLYGAPGAFVLPGRTEGREGWNLHYKRLTEGVRLSADSLRTNVALRAVDYFPAGALYELPGAYRCKETILVEGGGPVLMPPWMMKGQGAAYERWKQLPAAERGFWNRGAA